MPAQRSVRLYRPEDRDACEEIYSENERRGLVPAGYRHEFVSGLGDVSSRTFCVEEEGRILACGSISTRRLRPRGPRPVYSMLSFGLVHPDAQRRGVGRLLLRLRIAAMPILETGTHELHLLATTISTRYYAAQGFHAQEDQMHALGAILIPMFQTVDPEFQRENFEALKADGISPLPEWVCVPSYPPDGEKYLIRCERGILTDIIASIWNKDVSLQVRRICAGFSVMQAWARLAISRSVRRSDRYRRALLQDGQGRPQGILRPAKARAESAGDEVRIRGLGALTIVRAEVGDSRAVRLEAREADGSVVGWLQTHPGEPRLAELSFDWKMPQGAMLCLAVQMSRRASELGQGRAQNPDGTPYSPQNVR